jgi:uncharacterized membrane protein YfcA
MMAHGKSEDPRLCALFLGAAFVSSGLGLGVLSGTSADVARGLFFVLLLLAATVILLRARRETP